MYLLPPKRGKNLMRFQEFFIVFSILISGNGNTIATLFLNFLPTVDYVTIGHANLSTQVHSYHTAISLYQGYRYIYSKPICIKAYVVDMAETGFGFNIFCLRDLINWRNPRKSPTPSYRYLIWV